MAVIQWPDKLRGPLVAGFSREEVVGFRENELASGPAFIEPFSEDTPSFHNITYLFNNGDARRFQIWLREHKFKFLSPFFDGPLITEDDSVDTQECRYTADGYPQFTGKTVGGLYSYSARVLTRSIVNNDDAYAESVSTLWYVFCTDTNNGASLLDQGMNG